MIGSAVSEPPPLTFPFQAFRQVVHLLGHFLLVDDLGSTFQQAGVQVEDVARVSLATRRTAQDQRNLAVGYGLFGKVVVNDQRMAAGVTEIFADGGARQTVRNIAMQPGRQP